MDDMNAFEHQVSAELGQMAGPGRRIDGMAMVRTVSAPSSGSRFQSMFGATKLVVAGAILALFGGLLLAGVLTDQEGEVLPAAETEPPSLTPTQALLSDMVTEQIEPGVFRILNDGVRDLHVPPPRSGTRYHLNALTPEAMAVGQDGHPWLIRESRLLRLGEAGERSFRAPDWAPLWPNMAVDASGTFWGHQDPELSDDYRLASFDGATWTPHDWPDASEPESLRVAVAPDGSVIVGSGDRIARIRDGEWTLLPSWEGVTRGQVYYAGPVATDDTVWLACLRHIRTWEAGCEGLLRFDGTVWDVVTPVPERPDLYAGPLAVGPDGTLWVYLNDPEDPDDRFLARLRDDRWSVFAAEDGVPPLTSEWEYGSDLSVDADGTLWIATELASWDDARGPAPGLLSFPKGVLSFDGTTWRQYLADMDVQQVAAADGHVWALDGADHRGDGLHVITPEAVAAADAIAVEADGEAEPVDTTTTGLLPGVDLVTEEVGPGVYRIDGDGVRDLGIEHIGMKMGEGQNPYNLVAGLDGSVWVFGPDEFFRIGDSATRAATTETPNSHGQRAYVDPDGVLWVGSGGGLHSFADGTWQERQPQVHAFDMQRDGTIWLVRPMTSDEHAADIDPGWGTILERFGAAPLTGVHGPRADTVPGGVVIDGNDLSGTPTGINILVGPGTHEAVDLFDEDQVDVADHILLRPVGDGRSSVIDSYNLSWDIGNTPVVYADVGADGDIWLYQESESPRTGVGDGVQELEREHYLTHGRFDLGQVATYGAEHGVPVPAWVLFEAEHPFFRVGPDGRIWTTPLPEECSLASFDGTTSTCHLRGMSVAALDIAPDGSAWVLAGGTLSGGEPDPSPVVHPYVITPEAIAAPE